MSHAKKIEFPQGPAPYACMPEQSRGRLHAEPESANRSPFQRDRDRIIHSAAFRRLEYKTQVFVNHEGDHYRTRLTHSLEVGQLARSMSRSLGLNEDLAESVALAHDLGHPPFGHAGEYALQEAMQQFTGFDHNAQTIRVLTHLEQRYAEFDGLNLSWETLEGIAKHNGPLKNPHPLLAAYNATHPLELDSWPSAEAQVASLADDIAYHNHDIDDGLRAGLFQVEDLAELPIVGESFSLVRQTYPNLQGLRLAHEGIRRVINRMVMDLLQQTQQNIVEFNITTVDQVRNLGHALVSFSPPMQQAHKELRRFLMESMYRHYKVNRMTSKARRIILALFDIFMQEPECLPTAWQDQRGPQAKADTHRARLVSDYIAGMTDRYAIQEYQRLFDLTSQAAQR
jgi:dGTPase